MEITQSSIRENPTFLRYYEIWSTNPSSVVFAPLAEILILHRCYEEAIVVCKKGLGRNPDLVSGRVALARAYVGVGNLRRAAEEAEIVLARYPNHPEMLEILKVSRGHLGGETGVILPSELRPEHEVHWNTETMAEIFADQGNIAEACRIYENVLIKDPGNSRAKERLYTLMSGSKTV